MKSNDDGDDGDDDDHDDDDDDDDDDILENSERETIRSLDPHLPISSCLMCMCGVCAVYLEIREMLLIETIVDTSD